MDEELGRRLDEIERRLTALEGRLPPPLPGRPLARPSGVEVLDADRVARQRALLEQLAQASTTASEPRLRSSPAVVTATPDAAAQAADASTEPVTPLTPEKSAARAAASGSRLAPNPRSASRQPFPPPAPLPRSNIEQAIGLKWAGWVGGIVLVIGTALGVQYAYEQGWFAGMSAGLRVLLLIAGGGVLIGLGELVYRGVNRLAATGFYGAGVALLFMAAFVGNHWYGLYSQTAAVAIMAVAAAVGLAIASRANQVSVAFVAVLGATVTPALFDSTDFKTLPFFVYLLLLQGLAIGLCFWRRSPKWWTLRGLSLATTFLWTLAIISPDYGPPPRAMATLFAVLFAAIYQGELLWTTARRAAARPGRPVAGVIFSLLVTAALAAWLMGLTLPFSPHGRGGVLLALAAIAAVLGRVLARQVEREPLQTLGRGFDVQAILLLALAVPVALQGPAVLFGWMLLSVGLAVLSVVRRDVLALVMATLVWVLTVGCWFNGWTGGFDARAVWWTVAGNAVPAGVFVGAALAISGHVLGWAYRATARAATLRYHTDFGLAANLLDLAAAACFGGALLLSTPPTFATVAGLGYGWVLLVAAFVPVLGPLTPVAAGVIGAVAVKWVIFDVLTARLATHWTSDLRPFWNRQTAIGAALAVSVAVAGRAVRRFQAGDDADTDRRTDSWWAAVAGLAFVLVAFTIGMEIDRVVAIARAAGDTGGWPEATLRHLWLTVDAAACLAAWMLAVRPTLHTPDVRRQVADAARLLALLLAATFVLVDVPSAYLDGVRPAAVLVVNAQVVTALAVAAALMLTSRIDAPPGGTPLSGLAVLLIVLVTGSAEIDRYATSGRAAAAPWIVRQVGWSIYWGAVAVLTLVLGFLLRRRPLRLAALAVLAATLLKMTMVDLAGVGTGWRILSFLALGVLLLATSVLYGKFKDDPSPGRTAADPA